jgi:hypothetical protein
VTGARFLVHSYSESPTGSGPTADDIRRLFAVIPETPVGLRVFLGAPAAVPVNFRAAVYPTGNQFVTYGPLYRTPRVRY